MITITVWFKHRDYLSAKYLPREEDKANRKFSDFVAAWRAFHADVRRDPFFEWTEDDGTRVILLSEVTAIDFNEYDTAFTAEEKICGIEQDLEINARTEAAITRSQVDHAKRERRIEKSVDEALAVHTGFGSMNGHLQQDAPS